MRSLDVFVGILWAWSIGLWAFANSADLYTLSKAEENATSEAILLGIWVVGYLKLGTGIRLFVEKDSFETPELEICAHFASLIKSDEQPIDCSDEGHESGLDGKNLSRRSVETEANATAEAATTGLWNKPDNEPIILESPMQNLWSYDEQLWIYKYDKDKPKVVGINKYEQRAKKVKKNVFFDEDK